MALPFFKGAQFEKNPSGAIVADGKEVAHTIQCPHCSGHFLSVKGSGKKRGWCPVCDKMVCGQPRCMVHIPFGAKLDFAEAKNRGDEKVAEEIEKRYAASGGVRIIGEHG